MAVTHATSLRNTLADAVDTALGATANLRFRLTGTIGSPGTAVATLPMSATPFGAAASGTITANAITSDTNATGNASPVATATLDNGATPLVHCAVAASASDINMTGGLTIGAGDTVSCSSLTYSAPA